jgi:hypothetical protein
LTQPIEDRSHLVAVEFAGRSIIIQRKAELTAEACNRVARIARRQP